MVWVLFLNSGARVCSGVRRILEFAAGRWQASTAYAKAWDGREDTTAPVPDLWSDVTSKEKTASPLTRTASLGRIEVSPRVVASIVGHAANETYGVVGMAARGLRDGIAERLNRDNVHRGVEVELRQGGILIELYIIAQYGTRISEVAHNLMSAVKYSVEKTLGLDVIAVNVNVQGILLEGDGGKH
jgi:uncharacterized alkaline shock family protein YloU